MEVRWEIKERGGLVVFIADTFAFYVQDFLENHKPGVKWFTVIGQAGHWDILEIDSLETLRPLLMVADKKRRTAWLGL